jgi:hypothetical protein
MNRKEGDRLEFWGGEGRSSALRLKSKAETRIREVLITEMRKERCMGACSRTWKPVVQQVGLDIRFYSFV